MATSYEVNYDDERFQNVEAEKQAQLSQMNNAYNDMINNSDQFYDDQKQMLEDYKNTQTDLQNQQTDFAIQKIEQEKDKTLKDYTKEQKGAYADYQKASNKYGVNAEQMASQGLAGSGFSESSQVSMFNTYQNRVSTAREVYNQALLNYNNSIQEARLNNNSKLAEIAFQTLQSQLQLSLEAFQYKNTLVLDKMEKEQALNNTYYARWQDVQNQINTENALKEQIRQFDDQIAYYKEKDAKEYELEIKKLEEQKRQFDKEYELAKKASSSSSSSSSGGNSPKLSNTSSSSSGQWAKVLQQTTPQAQTKLAEEKARQAKVTQQKVNDAYKAAQTLYRTSKNKKVVVDFLARTGLSEIQATQIMNKLGIK